MNFYVSQVSKVRQDEVKYMEKSVKFKSGAFYAGTRLGRIGGGVWVEEIEKEAGGKSEKDAKRWRVEAKDAETEGSRKNKNKQKKEADRCSGS